MKRKYKINKHHPKTAHRQLLFVLLLGVLTISGFAVKQLFFTSASPIYHGPHLSKTLYKSGLDQQDVLGSRTNRWARSTPTPTKKPNPTPTPTPMPTPTVSQKPREYGIAIGENLPYFSQSEIDTYFSHLKDLGVSWIRYDFEWGLIQYSGPNSFDWTGTDRVVKTAAKYGMNTLGVIAYAPYWARLPSCRNEFACSPADPNVYGAFAGQVATHYAPMGVHHWEIWNEPNITMFWKPYPNATNYVALLKSAYSNIKKADPTAFILTAGFSPSGDEDGNIAPITFIRALYGLNPTKDFDAIAMHPYTYPALASFPATWNSWQQMGTIRQIMSDYGDSKKALWMTEYGAPTGGPGNARDTIDIYNFPYGYDYMSEDSLSVLMQDALEQYSHMTTPVGPLFWYSLHDEGVSRDTPENFFGLVRNDWSKKPAYDIFRNAINANQ
jgi:polysaccharide biosynthesis protein PslG